MRNITPGIILAISFAVADVDRAATGGERGDLAVRLVYDGEPPDAPIRHPGELVVNPTNRGIAHVLLYWRGAPAKTAAVHPDWDAKKLDKVTMTLERDRFDPPVAVAFTGQIFEFVNKSRHEARLHSELFAMDVLLADGATHERRFKAQESTAIPIANVTGELQFGYVFISDNPFAATSDSDGKIRIKNLPVGKHTFVVWHEIPGCVKEAHQGGMPLEWKGGRMKVEIAPGENDLGEFLLKPEVFRR